jgi:glycosyltransferase involved in cell wall biosynthesis
MISIIIPARNEEKRIENTLIKYLAYFEKEYDKNFEIIVVADNCTDRTVEICTKHHVFVEYSNKPLGKGGAVKRGFKAAKGQIVAFSDADGATSASELDKLIKRVRDFTCVIGNRKEYENLTCQRQPLIRRFLSKSYGNLVNAMFHFNIVDSQCGAKAFHKEALDIVINDWKLTGLAFDVELLYLFKRKGYKIIEVPIIWLDQKNSTVKLRKEIINMGLALIKLRLRYLWK